MHTRTGVITINQDIPFSNIIQVGVRRGTIEQIVASREGASITSMYSCLDMKNPYTHVFDRGFHPSYVWTDRVSVPSPITIGDGTETRSNLWMAGFSMVMYL